MKIKLVIACLSLCLIPKLGFSTSPPVIIDKYLSPYTGAGFMSLINNSYKAIDDYYLPSSSGKTDFLSRTGRAGKFLAQGLLGSFLMVTQHEVFGHGYRGREFGLNMGYDLRIFSGTTYFYTTYKNLSLNKQALLSAGGLEANSILGQQILNGWIVDENIDNRDVLFYGFNQTSAVDYVYITNPNLNKNRSGNDISSYIKEINAWHQNANALTVNKMRSAILWDLFDPALYNGLYGALISYIINAKPNQKLYMLEIDKYKYLPTGRVLMAPYGLEYQLNNYIKTPSNQLIQVNLRYGQTGFIQSYGIDLHLKPIWAYKKFIFANKLSVWQQPQLNTGSAKDAKSRVGVAEVIYTEYQLNNKTAVYAELGYKTAGYLPGNPVEAGLIVGLGFYLNI